MIWSIFSLSFRQWINRPWEVALAFVLPIVFFSIFAMIFGRGLQGDRTKPISIHVVDEFGDRWSHRLIEALKNHDGLVVLEVAESRDQRQQAKDLIQRGETKACLVIKGSEGLQAGESSASRFGFSIDILADRSDQLAAGYVEAAIRAILMQLAFLKKEPSIFDLPNQSGLGVAETRSGISEPGLGVHQAEGDEVLLAPATNAVKSTTAGTNSDNTNISLSGGSEKRGSSGDSSPVIPSGSPSGAVDSGSTFSLAPIQVVNILGDGKSNPIVSMYAAGIAVMFLLFNATSVSGVLIEERSNQTLDRLLASNLTMDQLLLGKWFYTAFLGILQVTVMFIWASLVFSVNLVDHLDGFVMMTIATAMAASGFSLFMATLCKSRSQLNGVSTVLLLTMSALGGSMIPRYLMSDSLQRLGLLTFNAWAIDGYDKVFWRELPVQTLAPQLAVLTISGVFFLCVARLLAVRWESK